MAQTSDVVLNGVSYQVVPGSYRKRNAPATAAVAPRDVRRLLLGPFSKGQRQAFDGGGSRQSSVVSAGWDSAGVGPAFDGAGVEPWPNSAAYADAAVGANPLPSTTRRGYGAVAGGNAYVGIGRYLYKSVAVTNNTWADFTQAADLGAGAVITGVVYYQDDLLVLLGSGVDIRRYNTGSGAVTTWRLGESGTVGCGYAGQLIYCKGGANTKEELRLSGDKWNGNAVTHKRYLDAPIVNMCLFNGQVAIATRASLYFMGGNPTPARRTTRPSPATRARRRRGSAIRSR
jgi:hypothetical protein